MHTPTKGNMQMQGRKMVKRFLLRIRKINKNKKSKKLVTCKICLIMVYCHYFLLIIFIIICLKIKFLSCKIIY